MKYIIKRPNGDTMTHTLENLATRFENGVVRADWPAKPEDGTEWSTVGAILAVESPATVEATPASSPVSNNLAPAACRRYQDAYLVASVTTTIGAMVKIFGIGLGLLVMLGAVIVGSQVDKTVQSFFGGALSGAVVAIPIYILGVLASALGQVLKATLDTAVHSSPFLKKEDMARVMSL
jgi:hypothetical protein